MKQRITFLTVAAMAAIIGMQAQNLLVDNFESGVPKWGAWGVDAHVIAENPNKTGINTSDNVYKLENAANWAGIFYDDETHGSLNFNVAKTGDAASGEYRYVHFKILRDNTASMVIKLTPTAYLTTEYWTSPNTEWQYIVIDLQSKNEWSENDLTGPYASFDIEPNKNASTTTLYLDDIYLSPSSEPITAQSTNIKNAATNKPDIRVTRSADGIAAAHISELDGRLKLEVYSMTGSLLEVVYDGAANAGAYNLPSFGAGVYLLKATTEQGTFCFKF